MCVNDGITARYHRHFTHQKTKLKSFLIYAALVIKNLPDKINADSCYNSFLDVVLINSNLALFLGRNISHFHSQYFRFFSGTSNQILSYLLLIDFYLSPCYQGRFSLITLFSFRSF